jgi:hypothetical protein
VVHFAATAHRRIRPHNKFPASTLAHTITVAAGTDAEKGQGVDACSRVRGRTSRRREWEPSVDVSKPVPYPHCRRLRRSRSCPRVPSPGNARVVRAAARVPSPCLLAADAQSAMCGRRSRSASTCQHTDDNSTLRRAPPRRAGLADGLPFARLAARCGRRSPRWPQAHERHFQSTRAGTPGRK